MCQRTRVSAYWVDENATKENEKFGGNCVTAEDEKIILLIWKFCFFFSYFLLWWLLFNVFVELLCNSLDNIVAIFLDYHGCFVTSVCVCERAIRFCFANSNVDIVMAQAQLRNTAEPPDDQRLVIWQREVHKFSWYYLSLTLDTTAWRHSMLYFNAVACRRVGEINIFLCVRNNGTYATRYRIGVDLISRSIYSFSMPEWVAANIL